MTTLRVEVVYALADTQDLVALELADGVTAREAVEASGIPASRGLPAELALGIFGKRISPLRRLRSGDRVEILRALAVDPKDARRRRARRPPFHT